VAKIRPKDSQRSGLRLCHFVSLGFDMSQFPLP
jgi:hypothetical protein